MHTMARKYDTPDLFSASAARDSFGQLRLLEGSFGVSEFQLGPGLRKMYEPRAGQESFRAVKQWEGCLKSLFVNQHHSHPHVCAAQSRVVIDRLLEQGRWRPS